MTPTRVFLALLAAFLVWLLVLWSVGHRTLDTVRVEAGAPHHDTFEKPSSTTTSSTSTTVAPTTTTTAVARSAPTTAKPRPARTTRVVTTGGDVWHDLAMCETGGTMNPRATSKTGRYLGLYQFDLDSYRRAGGTGDPRDDSPAEQRRVAKNWQRLVGWGAWPHCARKLGLA